MTEGGRQQIAVAIVIAASFAVLCSFALASTVAPPILVIGSGAVGLVAIASALIVGAEKLAASPLLAPMRRIMLCGAKDGPSLFLFAVLTSGIVVLGWGIGRGAVQSEAVNCGENAVAVEKRDLTGQVRSSPCDSGAPGKGVGVGERGRAVLTWWEPFGPTPPSCIYERGFVGLGTGRAGAFACPAKFTPERSIRGQPSFVRARSLAPLRIEQEEPLDYLPFPRFRFTIRNLSSEPVTLSRVGVDVVSEVQFMSGSAPAAFLLTPIASFDIVVPLADARFDVVLETAVEIPAGGVAPLNFRFAVPELSEWPPSTDAAATKFVGPCSDAIRRVKLEFIVGDRSVTSAPFPLCKSPLPPEHRVPPDSGPPHEEGGAAGDANVREHR